MESCCSYLKISPWMKRWTMLTWPYWMLNHISTGLTKLFSLSVVFIVIRLGDVISLFSVTIFSGGICRSSPVLLRLSSLCSRQYGQRRWRWPYYRGGMSTSCSSKQVTVVFFCTNWVASDREPTHFHSVCCTAELWNCTEILGPSVTQNYYYITTSEANLRSVHNPL